MDPMYIEKAQGTSYVQTGLVALAIALWAVAICITFGPNLFG